jgi:hypothetical protein
MKTLRSSAILLAVVLSGLVLHEAGHIVFCLLFGGKIESLAILPGIQLYPHFSRLPWDGWLANITFQPPTLRWQHGLVLFMGSGTTALLGCCALALLYTLKPSGLSRLFWLATAVLFNMDIIAYSIFPIFGMRHWLFIGGSRPEPLTGVLGMGLSQEAYFILLASYTIVLSVLILRGYRQIRKPKTNPGPLSTS